MVSGRKKTTAELVSVKPPIDVLLRQSRFPIHVVCDNIRSLENVGLIFRLSDAARVDKLYLCGFTGYPPLESDSRPPHVANRAGKVIAKTAIHTVECVPWSRLETAAEAVRDLKARGVQIVALEQTTESISYVEAAYTFPVCLVLGHEREGVGDEVLELADVAVHIPLFGMGNSLNVASAYAIAVYDLLSRLGGGVPSLQPSPTAGGKGN